MPRLVARRMEAVAAVSCATSPKAVDFPVAFGELVACGRIRLSHAAARSLDLGRRVAGAWPLEAAGACRLSLSVRMSRKQRPERQRREDQLRDFMVGHHLV